MAQSPQLDAYAHAVEIARALNIEIREAEAGLPDAMAVLVGAMALVMRAHLGPNSLLFMAYANAVHDLLMRAPMPKPATLAYVRGETDDDHS